MISVGIDVSKEKSTVCILKPYGEVVSSPYEITHTEQGLSELAAICRRLDGEVRVILEATGNYHLPVLTYLKEEGFFIYRCCGKLNVLFYQNNFFPFKISMPSSLATLVCLNGFIFSTTPSHLKREPVFLNQNVTSAFTHCSRILRTQP